ncbi:MAG: PEP-CTERM sorting domain-containing protein [Verrucomicrobiales bacterium]|nr:PEP-CTERM sorting domain-containing protein [Verrucomicrobiales bacterium]
MPHEIGTRLCTLAMCLAATATLLRADGMIAFNTKVAWAGINARVYDADGNPVSGAEYSAQLLWGLAADALAPIGVPVPFYSDKDYKLGYVDGGVVRVAETGAHGFVQMVAWATASGADYASALAAGGPTGRSNIIPIWVGWDDINPTLPGELVGLEGFQLNRGQIIPEPSTFALGLMGLGVLRLCRQGRRRP